VVLESLEVDLAEEGRWSGEFFFIMEEGKERRGEKKRKREEWVEAARQRNIYTT